MSLHPQNSQRSDGRFLLWQYYLSLQRYFLWYQIDCTKPLSLIGGFTLQVFGPFLHWLTLGILSVLLPGAIMTTPLRRIGQAALI